MRKKLKGVFQQISPEEVQRAIQQTGIRFDHIIEQIENTTTFGRIAKLIGYSDEFVRLRLVKHPEVTPVGKRYRVPKAVAVEFITTLFA